MRKETRFDPQQSALGEIPLERKKRDQLIQRNRKDERE